MSFREQIQATIAEHGHQLIGVGGEPGVPGFTYSIGLTSRLGYELIAVGLPYHIAGTLLNEAAANGFELDVPNTDLANLPLLFKICDKDLGDLHQEFVVQADHFYGKEVKVVQMILSDREGRLPSHPEYDHEYMGPRQRLFVSFAK